MAELVEDAEEASAVAEPDNFFEKEEVSKMVAQFDGGSANAAGQQSMPMLVAVRVRPLWNKEMEAGDYNTVRVLEGKVVVVLDPWYDADLNPNRAKEKKYAFDAVFDEDVSQEEVYQQTARGLVGGVLDGYNSSVFAYGATGAGKTHTMLGSLEAPGVMVNTLHDMFVRMKDSSFNEAKFKVTLSYMEIYNELIKDLLQPTSVDLKLNEDPARGMVVQGITEYGADSADEILELLHRGNMHRAVEPTAANQVSSRSHAVLQITVEQSEATAHVTGNVRIGKLSMVDLAGSERASKTDNTGQRLKEGANINRSLLALGNCITALADKNRKGHVPFRDSKMTRLLKDSLGGNCRTVMIANISPSHRQFEETINTLKYSNRAKNLKTQVARNVVSVSAHIAEYQRVIMELRNEVADLKSALKQVGPEAAPVNERKQRSLDYVDNLEKQHMQAFKDTILSAVAERRKLLQKLTDHSKAISEARAKSGGSGGDDKDADGKDAAGPTAEAAAALADVRRQLQQNQQTINEIVATAVQRISSQERLQLLQLLVRGKFLEVMNDEMSSELEMRRALTTAAMSQGALPQGLMNEAMATESWYAEHRTALDFHAKMAKTEMGGSLRAPSIAQLLDQNLVSPQQATASENLGELVRPFTNHRKGERSGKGGKGGGGKGGGGGGGGDDARDGRGSAEGKKPIKGSGPSGGGGDSPSLLTDIVNEGSDRSDSASGSDRRFGNSASSSLQSSRGPTSQRGRPPPAALASLRSRQPRAIPTGGRRVGSASSQSPTHSQPPTPNSSRPPSNSRTQTTVTKLSVPAQRVKRFKPAVGGGGPPGAPKPPGGPSSGLPALGSGAGPSSGLPAIAGVGVPGPPSAVKIASARAAAAAKQPHRVQALGEAYGTPPALQSNPGRGVKGFINSNQQRLPPRGVARRPSNSGISGVPYQPAAVNRVGTRLPPAAPSARLAARLQGGPSVSQVHAQVDLI